MNVRLHCQLCGSLLQKKQIEARPRDECPKCGWIYYPQLKVTAGVMVENDRKILLVKRGMDPWRNFWCMPAGYVEDDEPPRNAAEREALEETGLEIKAVGIIDVLLYDDDPRGNGILILYEGEITGGMIKKNREALDIQFFSMDEVKSINLAGGSHNNAILNWSGKNSMD